MKQRSGRKGSDISTLRYSRLPWEVAPRAALAVQKEQRHVLRYPWHRAERRETAVEVEQTLGPPFAALICSRTCRAQSAWQSKHSPHGAQKAKAELYLAKVLETPYYLTPVHQEALYNCQGSNLHVSPPELPTHYVRVTW